MDNIDDQIDDLLTEIYALPESPERLELIEQAIALVDRQHDIPLGYHCRQLLMQTALETGDTDKMLVAFSWCASMSAQRPDLLNGDSILWEYRWVVSELPNFPDVSRETIEAMMNDMETRYREVGSQLRAVHLMKNFTYTKLGDHTNAEQFRLLFNNAPRDFLSDAPRQEQNLLIFYHATFGEYDKALALGQNVLDGQVYEPGFFGQDCSELLLPLLELNRVPEAIRIQKKGYPYVAEHPSWLWNIAQNIEFLARIDDFDNALSILKEHFAYAMRTPRMVSRFFFLRAIWILAERLNHANDVSRMMKLDKLARKHYDSMDMQQPLTNSLWREIMQLAQRFDQRNGNEFFTQQCERAQSVVQD